jgi:hypothetical protein
MTQPDSKALEVPEAAVELAHSALLPYVDDPDSLARDAVLAAYPAIRTAAMEEVREAVFTYLAPAMTGDYPVKLDVLRKAFAAALSQPSSDNQGQTG